jgi:hypothetical protein
MNENLLQEDKFPPPDSGSSHDEEFYSKKELLPKLTKTKGIFVVDFWFYSVRTDSKTLYLTVLYAQKKVPNSVTELLCRQD